MTLARAWTRHLFGASGVALLAPVTMLAVLALLALGGGFGGLGSLGQLISGPAVPVGGATLPGGGPVTPRTVTPLIPVVPAEAATRRAPTRVAATVPGATGVGPANRGGGPTLAGGGGAERIGLGGPGVTHAPSPPRTPAPPAPKPTPPPSPVGALVDQVVAVGVGVTNTLPAPLAAIGTGVIQGVGQTLNTLLAPHS